MGPAKEALDAREPADGEAEARPAALPGCPVRILFVTDRQGAGLLGGSFGATPHGLSGLESTLSAGLASFAQFEISRAHRQDDPGSANGDSAHRPHYTQFRFDQPGLELDRFHEIWLFGTRAGNQDPEGLSPSELASLTAWMDRGGGLFATGGPDDLGAALSARLPRVRSMRRWHVPQDAPAPRSSPKGLTGARPAAMAIMPRRYPQASWRPSRPILPPHPILWRPGGVIERLPLHPGAGVICDATDIDLGAVFGEVADGRVPEYPGALDDGPRPEVIAWITLPGEGGGPEASAAPAPRTAGVVAAYDGHQAGLGQKNGGVGRVVADASWHHWFNLGCLTEPDRNGPDSAQLRHYQRNVALWLAPAPLQRAFFLRSVWREVSCHPLNGLLNLRQPIWLLGTTVHEWMAHQVHAGLLREWLQGLLPRELLLRWHRATDDPGQVPLIAPPLELLEVFALGGIVREMLAAAQALSQGRLEQLSEPELAEALAKGCEYGLIELLKIHRWSRTMTDDLMGQLRDSLDRLPASEQFLTED